MKNKLRLLQTYFPFLHDLRFKLKFQKMKLLKQSHDVDFDLISKLNITPQSLFVDIGSNRGEAIWSMLINTKEQVNIIGFEPNPFIFDNLQKEFSNKKNVTLHNFGIGDKDNTLKFYIPFYQKWMFDGLASFNYDEAANWLKDRLWKFNPDKLNVKKIECKIKPLDSFNLNPVFIKIDVQGFEYEVLKGAIETLKKSTPIILIESIQENHKALLSEIGYQFYSYSNGKLIEDKGLLNTFCIHPSSSLVSKQLFN